MCTAKVPGFSNATFYYIEGFVIQRGKPKNQAAAGHVPGGSPAVVHFPEYGVQRRSEIYGLR